MMSIKDVKAEARQKLALNMHQAIVIYTLEFVIIATLVAVITLACMCFNTISAIAAIIMIVYGSLLLLITLIGTGLVGYAMVDFYIVSYKCKPYNIRRLGDTIARNGITKIFMLNLVRGLLGFLLTLCLIVPGVFYLSRTAMANNLLNANPKMKASDALKASGKVMAGKTGMYIKLMFSLIGWYALAIITLGLGLMFVIPYANLCKTVYYKRCLQGDTVVYRVPVQPISPVVEQEQAPLVSAAAAGPEPVAQEAVVPSEEPVLGEPIVAEEREPVQEVPITVTMKTQPGPDLHAIEDSDLVEIVKPITTVEMNESDVFSKKVDGLYNPGAAPNHSDHNYFDGKQVDGVNDFSTHEMTPIDAVLEDTGEEPEEKKVESVMDDSQFADFMSNFNNVPKPEPEFKPLTRNSDSEAAKAADAAAAAAAEAHHAAEPAPHIARPSRPDNDTVRMSARDRMAERSDRSRFDRGGDDRIRTPRR